MVRVTKMCPRNLVVAGPWHSISHDRLTIAERCRVVKRLSDEQTSSLQHVFLKNETVAKLLLNGDLQWCWKLVSLLKSYCKGHKPQFLIKLKKASQNYSDVWAKVNWFSRKPGRWFKDQRIWNVYIVCAYISHGRNTNADHITLQYRIQESRVTRQSSE